MTDGALESEWSTTCACGTTWTDHEKYRRHMMNEHPQARP